MVSNNSGSYRIGPPVALVAVVTLCVQAGTPAWAESILSKAPDPVGVSLRATAVLPLRSMPADHEIRRPIGPPVLGKGDFDEDGVVDLIRAETEAGGGRLDLYRGRVAALYPGTSLPQRKLDSRLSPFLAAEGLVEISCRPAFLGVGDFDADGHKDVLAASRQGRLCLAFGDGHGGFPRRRTLELDAKITTMAIGEIHRRDGLEDVAIALAKGADTRLLIYHGPGGAFGEGTLVSGPDTIGLPSEALALAFGHFDDHYPIDVAIATRGEILTLAGRDQALPAVIQGGSRGAPELRRIALPFTCRAMAVGQFLSAKGSQREIAVLADTGDLHLLRRKGDLWQRLRVAEVPVADPRSSGRASGTGSRLLPLRLSVSKTQDLLWADPHNGRLWLLAASARGSKEAPAHRFTAVDLTAKAGLQGLPASILPLRLTPDAHDDLVMTGAGPGELVLSLAAPMATIVVNSTDDTIAQDGVLTLREAIHLAEGHLTVAELDPQERLQVTGTPAAAQTDAVLFDIPGPGPMSIALTLPLPSLTDPISLDATTQTGFAGTPVIELDGSLISANHPDGNRHGLRVTAGSSLIRGLAINNFSPLGLSYGIDLSGGGGNFIEGNFIGTDLSGTVVRGNNGGLRVGSTQNTIGGTVAAARNLVSGNGKISANDGSGIFVEANDNVLQGNFVGTDVHGTSALGSLGEGIFIRAADDNVVGGTTAGVRNLVSGNGAVGLRIHGSSSNVNGNLVQGNFVGTDVSGSWPLGNGSSIGDFSGVSLRSNFNTVGGTTPAARNVISGNRAGASAAVGSHFTEGNVIRGNFIGTDATGTFSVGNQGIGVDLEGGRGNLVGGDVAGAGNVVSGHLLYGISISGSGSSSSGPNVVWGNLIGTDSSGTVALPNDVAGISIDSALSDVVGGSAAGAANVISGNGLGILVRGPGNVIQGNLIGTDATGSVALGNLDEGIVLWRNASFRPENNLIGGSQPGEGNVIAWNGAAGITALEGSGNSFLGNAVHANLGLGIDLDEDGSLATVDGATANDPGDADAGANDLQNHPVLDSAVSTASGVEIAGSLDSTPDSDFEVQIFASSACDPSGSGQAERFLVSVPVTTDAAGSARFQVVVAGGVDLEDVVTATATNSAASTSELSGCVVVSPESGPLSITSVTPPAGGRAGIVSIGVHGTGFVDGSTVVMRRGEGQEITATETAFTQATLLSATFDLAAAALGLWDVVVTRPEGASAVLTDGFMVLEGGEPEVWVEILGRELVRAGRTTTHDVVFGNSGEVDWNGLGTLTVLVPEGFPSAEVSLNGASLGTFMPRPQVDGRRAALSSPAVLGHFTLPAIDVAQEGRFSITFIPPAGLSGEIAVTPILWPPVLPPTVSLPPRDMGEAVLALMEVKAREMGFELPTFDESLREIFTAELTKALVELIESLTREPLIHLALADFPELLRRAVEQTLDSLESEFQAAVQAFRATWVQMTEPDNFDFFRSALLANVQATEPGVVQPPARLFLEALFALDPNLKLGPRGAGDGRHVSLSEPIRYSVLFENLESATASVQELVVTDQLDPGLVELATFRLGPIAFADHQVSPPPGVSDFTADVDLRPDTDLLVRIEAGLDRDLALVTWRLTALDPATGGLPDDPLAGFLPPNQNPPEGEGRLLFTVAPRQDLAHGTEITNEASITFDFNAPIETPVWQNTVDILAPTSRVAPLEATQCSASFQVSWTSADAGAGVGGHAVLVSRDGGEFLEWRAPTPELSGSFSGIPGASYAFYSVARDAAGNVEASPAMADAVTAVVNGHDDDADDWLSSCDNCPDVANPDQADDDADGAGQACDCDDADPTVVFPDRCGVCGGDGGSCEIFSEGFESGDFSRWSRSIR